LLGSGQSQLFRGNAPRGDGAVLPTAAIVFNRDYLRGERPAEAGFER
jgi:hypothetical protein